MAQCRLRIFTVVFLMLAGSAQSAWVDLVTFTFEGDFSGPMDVNDLNAATTPVPVPAPGATLLAAIGLATVASMRRRLA